MSPFKGLSHCDTVSVVTRTLVQVLKPRFLILIVYGRGFGLFRFTFMFVYELS